MFDTSDLTECAGYVAARAETLGPRRALKRPRSRPQQRSHDREPITEPTTSTDGTHRLAEFGFVGPTVADVESTPEGRA